MKKSIFGLSENLAGLVSYAGLFVTGIMVLILEKDNKTVRFHALQSSIWFLLLGVLNLVLGAIDWIPLIGWAAGLVSWFVGLLSFVSWIFLMYTAYTGKTFKIPVIGDVVSAQINK